jgi:hypothetical protein
MLWNTGFGAFLSLDPGSSAFLSLEPGSSAFLILEPGYGIKNIGSGLHIPPAFFTV